ncbi:hypothetical protein [Nodosilinea nodulosa]|uniref:hypothetical protein n=1 Tax=Nodosilinea nodulosa TaxID=416001 RepID=UPI0002EADEB1|nr:hypothetical protein [Nodosilinea nodulosa]
MDKILAGLASLMVVATAPMVAHAQTPAPSAPGGTTTVALTQNLTPFQLVNLAYEGGLQDQGIPSYGQFENAYAQNKVDAHSLVAAAIQGRYVPANTAQDGGYLNGVRLQLRSVAPDSNSYRLP